MRYKICPNCGEKFELTSVDRDGLGIHTTCPMCKGSFDIDIEDYIYEKGTRVKMPDGNVGVIAEYVWCGFPMKIEDMQYKVCPEEFHNQKYQDEHCKIFQHRSLSVPADWRVTRRTEFGIDRECHFIKNREDSNVPCYGCIDRAKCNALMLERLAQYEDTGLLPEEILKMKEKTV